MIRRSRATALALALTCALSGVAGAGDEVQKPSDVIALVNGVPITRAECNEAATASCDGLEPCPDRRRLNALLALIDRELMRQFLAANTVEVTQAEVDRRVAQMENALKARGMSVLEFCQDTRQTLDQFKASVAAEVRWGVYADKHATAERLETYYRENKDEFDKTTVRAQHLALRVASEAEAKAVCERLAALREEHVRSGTGDFEALVKRHSQHASATTGGDLGWFPRKWIVEESLAKAAFALETGEVSAPVRTAFGWHLVRVTDRRMGRSEGFEAMRESVRRACLEELRESVLREQHKKAKVEIFAGR